MTITRMATTTERPESAAVAAENARLPNGLRVAIVQHWLTSYGGAERVLEGFARIFPRADFYALVVSERTIPAALRGWNIKGSFVGKIPGAKRWHRHFLPLYPLAAEQFDLDGYDLVISSEAGPAKGVITQPETCHICYCHTPMRYVWDMYHDYRRSMNPLTRTVFSLTAHYARQWDMMAAARVDQFVANSRHVAARIAKYYRRSSTVIYPPANVEAGYISEKNDDYYLVVSRLVPYKRVDLAIEACNRLQRRLRVVGTGPEFKSLRKKAGPTIEFLGHLDDPALSEQYAQCRALLFPGEEDLGLVPIEAQSYGRPVIAYGKGGALETVEGLCQAGTPELASGLFFHQQTADALRDAIVEFEHIEPCYSPEFIRARVRCFGVDRFQENFTAFLARQLSQASKT
jgi:glycosyltransferase involved in cell wall biosynthesis